ncbi:MAG: ATP-binding protein [Ignavibacteria bacterium]|nr:ATP-binding protein [Ignavibacteria bacterium]
MKISRKLTILLLVAFVISILLLVLLRYYDVMQRKVLIDAQRTGYESIINNVMILKNEKYASCADDYSGWDDMVAYIENHSEIWASSNLTTVISTFKVDYVWVYNDKEELLHHSRNEETQDIENLRDHVDIKSIFEKDPMRNFFIKINDNYVQVFGGTIVPTSDYSNHKSKPYGYYLIGKVWDKKYIEEFEKATDSKIKILPLSDTSFRSTLDTDIDITRQLLDYKNDAAFNLNFRKSISYIKEFDNLSYFSIVISSMVWIVIVVIYITFTKRWITTPLSRVEQSLLNSDSDLLDELLLSKNEFKDIAELIKKFFVINRDLSNEIIQREKTEEKLLENEKKLETVLNATKDSIIMVDRDYNIVSTNIAFANHVGKTIDELTGKPILDFIPDERKNILLSHMKESFDKGAEMFFEDAFGNIFWNNAVYPIINDSGKTVRLAIFSTDVSEFKRNEQSLKKAEEKASEMSKLKSSFLANMSHELRTPMVGVLGFTEILKDSIKEPDLRKMADMVNLSGKRLMKTLNLILDLSRIESGKIEVNCLPVNLVKTAGEVTKSFEKSALKKELALRFSSSHDEVIANIDEDLYWQVMNNLISNAVKYTIKGEINVSVSAEKSNGIMSAVTRVKDTGIGIPSESMKIIFDEFRQVSEGYGRKFEGTGLGLTITKSFVEKLNGKILVESQEGAGTTFTVVFPLLETELDEIIPGKEINSKYSGSGIRKADILCVDDDSITRDFIDVIFNMIHNVEFANSGESAVELAKEKKYSLILMDINLGKGLSGIEAANIIRTIPGYANVPIVAMTAYAMSGDKEEFFDAGLDAYISKPFDVVSIKKLVQMLLKGKAKK